MITISDHAVYVSPVGLQIMAVLNPFLALSQAGLQSSPRMIQLIATPRTSVVAERLKSLLVQRGHQVDVTVGSIPHVVLKENLRVYGDCVFNIGAGFSFEIATALINLSDEAVAQCAFVYAESNGVHVIRPDNPTYRYSLVPLPQIEDVFSLQEIPHKWLDSRESAKLGHLLAKSGEHGKIRLKPVRVGNVNFDNVMNSGNTLRFFKVITGADRDSGRRQARALMALLRGRDEFGGLLHRSVIVATNDKRVANRLRTESIHARVVRWTRATEGAAAEKMFRLIMGAYHIAAPLRPRMSRIEAPTGSRVLLVVVDKDLLPSLIALWSHKPDIAVLLFSPGDPAIERYVTSMKTNPRLMPAGRLVFCPISMLGNQISNLKIFGSPLVEVNVTPGSKGQAFHLAHWAIQNAAELISMVNRSQTLENLALAEKRPRPLVAPPPEVFLRLAGHSIEVGKRKQDVQSKELVDRLSTIGQFLARIHTERTVLNRFPYRNIHFRGAHLNRDGESALISVDNGSTRRFLVRGGLWFEEFVAFQFALAGADDVLARIRIKSEDDHGEDRFQTDIDAVARFNSQYYVISVKADRVALESDQGIGEIEKVKADAGIFGRFTVPLFVLLYHVGKPTLHKGIYVFGCETLLNTRELRQLIELARSSLQTT